MKKDRFFQYATKTHIYEDTGLIGKQEAYDLWDKYKEDFKKKLAEGESPQMIIWKDCIKNTNYAHVERELYE